MRILIVDDNKESLYILESLLKRGGYEVVSAGNGAEALEKLCTESIDIIVSDVLMPVMDGFKLCKEVKKKDELKNIPFILYTATYKDKRDEKLALQLGADKYILKPAEPEELIKIIQGVIRDVEKGKFEPKKPAFEEEEEIFKLYSERLVNKLEKKMLDLEREITVRKQAEKRIEHLNLVLRAIRSVNQLIVRERDRDRLIRDACRNFIKNRGFYSAWIALVDESRRLVTAAEAGLGKAFQPLLKNLKQGNLPNCMQRVLAKPGILTIKDPASTCGDCPLANIYKERGVFSSRLEHDGKIYGILTVSFPADYFSGKEERSLFKEIVGDIAYALHHIELEEERKRAEEELKSSRTQLRNLVARLQSIREEERRLIAREIHDELGQTLTALKMDLYWLAKRMPKDQRPFHEKTKSMSKLIDKTIQRIKRISAQLRPGLLDYLGLPAAIEWEGKEFQNRTGIKCEVNIDSEDITLDQDRSTAIFRIFQETLTNAARHANAKKIKVSLKEKAGKLELRVRDNGKGITEKQISDPKSYGLIGMRERAQFLGGEVEIKGVQDKGTTVTTRIPFPKKGKT